MGKKAEPVLGYNVKTKQKEEMKDLTINFYPARKTYMAKGKGVETGANLCATMGKPKVDELLESGRAEKGEGWEEEKTAKKAVKKK